AQGGIEAAVAHIDQRAVSGDWQHVQLGLGEQRERSLAAAEDRVQVEAALAVPDVGEVVAGQAPVKLRKMARDQARLLALNGVDQTVSGAHEVRPPLDSLQFGVL